MAGLLDGLNIDVIREKAKIMEDWAEKCVTNGYNILVKLIKDIGSSIDKGMFDGISSIFFNSIAYNLIGIIVVVWLIYHLRSGFSREDIFKGGIWLITLCFIYGILSNYGAYAEFKSWFDIPSHILQAGISSLAGGKSIPEILAEAFVNPVDLHWDAYKSGIMIYKEGFPELGVDGNGGGSLDDMYNIIMSWCGLILWSFVTLLIAALILIIFIIQIATSMSLVFFGCFAPIMVILLITPQTRPFFFSWLKNYISISLYIPLSILPILIVMQMGKLTNINGPSLFVNTSYFVFLYIIGILIACYILFKIPEWINIIMGTQEGHSNMAMAQSVLGGSFALAKGGVGATLKTGGLAFKGVGAGMKGIGKTTMFMKNPIQNTKSGFSNAKSAAGNKIKEMFGFKASSQHHDKN